MYTLVDKSGQEEIKANRSLFVSAGSTASELPRHISIENFQITARFNGVNKDFQFPGVFYQGFLQKPDN